MSSINVAIIRVGNCASALVQGIHKYIEADSEQEIHGTMNTLMNDYHIGDIKIVATFDIDKEKVGKDLSEAIYKNNYALKFHEVPKKGVTVDAIRCAKIAKDRGINGPIDSAQKTIY